MFMRHGLWARFALRLCCLKVCVNRVKPPQAIVNFSSSSHWKENTWCCSFCICKFVHVCLRMMSSSAPKKLSMITFERQRGILNAPELSTKSFFAHENPFYASFFSNKQELRSQKSTKNCVAIWMLQGRRIKWAVSTPPLICDAVRSPPGCQVPLGPQGPPAPPVPPAPRALPGTPGPRGLLSLQGHPHRQGPQAVQGTHWVQGHPGTQAYHPALDTLRQGDQVLPWVLGVHLLGREVQGGLVGPRLKVLVVQPFLLVLQKIRGLKYFCEATNNCRNVLCWCIFALSASGVFNIHMTSHPSHQVSFATRTLFQMLFFLCQKCLPGGPGSATSVALSGM